MVGFILKLLDVLGIYMIESVDYLLLFYLVLILNNSLHFSVNTTRQGNLFRYFLQELHPLLDLVLVLETLIDKLQQLGENVGIEDDSCEHKEDSHGKFVGGGHSDIAVTNSSDLWS